MSVTTKEKVLARRPDSLAPAVTHYCPGCGHGVLHRLVAEVIDELGIAERTVGVASVGCSVFAYDYFDLDFVQVPHGRAPAAATGLKRARPDLVVFTYQGDGDMAAIGTAEIIHAAVRGERFTAVMYNNSIYGMTGGQMSPTTLPGMVTDTTPAGRDPAEIGYPFLVAETLAAQPGAVYVARTRLGDMASIVKTRRALLRAFKAQLDGEGFSMVEVLGSCPVNWGMSPSEANAFVAREMVRHFPLGVFRDGPATPPAVAEADGGGGRGTGGNVSAARGTGAQRPAQEGTGRGDA